MRNGTLLFFCLLALAAPSWAGTEIKARLQSYSDKEAWADLEVAIDQNKLRLDVQGPSSRGSLIYDREASVIVLVDDLRQTTLTIASTEQSALKLLGTVALGMAESQAEKGNGEEQKTFALVRKNIRALFNGAPRLEEKGVRQAGFDCDKYVTDLEGGKIRAVWVTSPEKTGMEGEDYDTLRSLIHLSLDLTGDELAQLGADPEDFQRLVSEPMLPIVSVLYAKGKPASRFEILSLRPQSFRPESFDPPARYQAIGLMDLLKPKAKTP